MNIICVRKHIVDMDLVNDITCTLQNCYYICGHTFFMTKCYSLNNKVMINTFSNQKRNETILRKSNLYLATLKKLDIRYHIRRSLYDRGFSLPKQLNDGYRFMGFFGRKHPLL